MNQECQDLVTRYSQLKDQFDETVLKLDNLQGAERNLKSVHGRILNNKLLMVKQKIEDLGAEIPVHNRLKGLLKEV